MRVLVPILNPSYSQEHFIQRIVRDASVVYLLLVLDPKSAHNPFGFKTSEIMLGRETVDLVKNKIKENKRLCTDMLEWGDTLEKIVQIAEMKNVDKIMLYNAENNPHFVHTINDVQSRTKIVVECVDGALKK